MLRLAVTTNAETLSRIRAPLMDRGVEAVYIQPSERTMHLDADLGDFDIGFVYPPRIMEGGVIDALLEVPWVNDRETILRSRNKAGTIARLDRAGLPTPKTVMVSNPVSEAALLDVWAQFDPPVVVKPNSTTRGVGVTKVDDLDSFLGVVDYLELVHDFRATADRSFLVQAYLPNAQDYRVMCVDGEYAGAVQRHLPDQSLEEGRWKHNVHRGAEAAGIALDRGDEVRKLAEHTAAVLNIDWLGVDVLVSEGRVVVAETNARPTVDAVTKYEDYFYDRFEELLRTIAH